MGLSFSKSSSNTAANTGEEHETAFQQFTNSVRRSFRVKRHTTDDAKRSSLPSRTSADRLTNTSTPARPGIPESFKQQTAASVSPATASKGTVEHPAKSPTTSAETKVAAPKTPEAAPAIARVAEAPQHTAYIPVSPKEVKREEERSGEENKAMDLLKGAIRAGDEQEEKKDDKRVEEKKDEEKEKLHHVGDILSQLAPADTSGDKSPETDTPAKPTVSLMAALEKRKAMKEKEEKAKNEEDDEADQDGTLTYGVSNVLESIAAQSSSIRSKEAATLMAAFTVPPQSPSEVKEEEEEQKEKEDKKDKDKEEEEEGEKEQHEERESKKEEEDDKKEHQEDKEHRKEKWEERYEEWKEEGYKKYVEDKE
ncbi:hypothetical protein TSMEX_008424 [Taenia solium]|eukprot:TsM_000899900 transcript=TsM_000899900 gene=TsM_000899900